MNNSEAYIPANSAFCIDGNHKESCHSSQAKQENMHESTRELKKAVLHESADLKISSESRLLAAVLSIGEANPETAQVP